MTVYRAPHALGATLYMKMDSEGKPYRLVAVEFLEGGTILYGLSGADGEQMKVFSTEVSSERSFDFSD